MSDNITEFPKGNYGVEFIGPFPAQHRVTSGGYIVPYLSASPNDDGTIELSLDNRFGIHGRVTKEEAERWIPFLANAMAVSAGYSCHGENCNPTNEFKVKLIGLSELP